MTNLECLALVGTERAGAKQQLVAAGMEFTCATVRSFPGYFTQLIVCSTVARHSGGLHRFRAPSKADEASSSSYALGRGHGLNSLRERHPRYAPWNLGTLSRRDFTQLHVPLDPTGCLDLTKVWGRCSPTPHSNRSFVSCCTGRPAGLCFEANGRQYQSLVRGGCGHQTDGDWVHVKSRQQGVKPSIMIEWHADHRDVLRVYLIGRLGFGSCSDACVCHCALCRELIRTTTSCKIRTHPEHFVQTTGTEGTCSSPVPFLQETRSSVELMRVGEGTH